MWWWYQSLTSLCHPLNLTTSLLSTTVAVAVHLCVCLQERKYMKERIFFVCVSARMNCRDREGPNVRVCTCKMYNCVCLKRTLVVLFSPYVSFSLTHTVCTKNAARGAQQQCNVTTGYYGCHGYPVAVERGELLVLRAGWLDDAPLIRCELTSHDAEKPRHSAATWRERRKGERRGRGREVWGPKKGKRKNGRRMETKTEWKDRERERRGEGGRYKQAFPSLSLLSFFEIRVLTLSSYKNIT